LALGAAIGAFAAITPTIGIQTLLVVFLAWLFRANKVIGIPFVWATNPATIVPVYYPCYVVGRTLLGGPPVGMEWWQQLTSPPGGWFAMVHFYWSRMTEIAVPLWIGCIVVGLATAMITYVAVYLGVSKYRRSRAARVGAAP
jgi:uncharacterized protein (DUF2062 family)